MQNVLNSQNVDPLKNNEEVGLKGIFNPTSSSKMEETLRMVIKKMDVSMFQNVEKEPANTNENKGPKPVMKFDTSSINNSDRYYKKITSLDEEIKRIERGKKLETTQAIITEKPKVIIPIESERRMILSEQTTQRAINSTHATTLGVNSYYRRVSNLESAIKEIEIGKKAAPVAKENSSRLQGNVVKTTAQVIQYDSRVKRKDTSKKEQAKQAKDKREVKSKQEKQPKVKKKAEPKQERQPKSKKEAEPKQAKQSKVKRKAEPKQERQPKAKRKTEPKQAKQPKGKREVELKKEKKSITKTENKEKRTIKKAKSAEDTNRLTEPKKRGLLKRIILQMKYDLGKYEFIEYEYLKGEITKKELEFYKNSDDRDDRKYYREVQEYEDISKDIAVRAGWTTFKLGLATALLAGTLSISNNVIQGIGNSTPNPKEKIEITIENISEEQLNATKQRIDLIKTNSNYNFDNLSEEEQIVGTLKIEEIVNGIGVRSFEGEFLRVKDQEFLEEILIRTFANKYSNYSDDERRDLKKLVFELLPKEKQQYVRDPEVLIEIEKKNQEKEAKTTEDYERN